MCDGIDHCFDNSDEEEGCKLWELGEGTSSMLDVLNRCIIVFIYIFRFILRIICFSVAKRCQNSDMDIISNEITYKKFAQIGVKF